MRLLDWKSDELAAIFRFHCQRSGKIEVVDLRSMLVGRVRFVFGIEMRFGHEHDVAVEVNRLADRRLLKDVFVGGCVDAKVVGTIGKRSTAATFIAQQNGKYV